MRIKDKRVAGEILGRDGISDRIIMIAENIVANGSRKNAIMQAGRMKLLAEASTCDEYWREKSSIGEYSEEHIFLGLKDGFFSKIDATEDKKTVEIKS
tara:strand:+ start:197 stop:490 length:294 start_codon:yes stop_codon:yes gene_type:complete